ncbi:uncharacterized protein LOC134707052 [Mytilus trossulus]|uniref:uncharacterized protein LOC134707052 n=1 Tax=Mytilus trossulus TaxID=6551 RepID=UPI003003CC57
MTEKIKECIPRSGLCLDQFINNGKLRTRESSSSSEDINVPKQRHRNSRNRRRISSIHTDQHDQICADFHSDLPPSCTCHWTLYNLESLGVYYKYEAIPCHLILDIVYDQTGMFGHLTLNQKVLVKKLQDQIEFSFNISDLHRYNTEEYYREIVENLSKNLLSVVEDFTTSTALMVHYQSQRDKYGGKLSEAVFNDLFKSFVRMVNLVPGQGEEWKAQMTILQQTVTSESDIVIMTKHFVDSVPQSIVAVVSIEEVNKLYQGGNESTCSLLKRHMNKRQFKRMNGDTSSSSNEYEISENRKPEIYKRVNQTVLGQHGGELLVHAQAYGSRFASKSNCCRFHPGMIVIGTQVILTLLEFNYDHMDKLHNESVNENSRSWIYYSDPKDFLKKEDRDLLIESFVRLSN